MKRITMRKTMAALLLTMLMATSASAAFKFGIISDTQWTATTDPANANPNTIAAKVITQVNKEFIAKGVKFVVAVGDMVDTGSQTNDYARALYSQELYNAGIGFYPTRGNHEAANGTYATSDADYWHAYPQMTNGSNNATPSDITWSLLSLQLPTLTNPPVAASGSIFTVGQNFTFPTAANTANNSTSYAFQYENATFMLLDQFKSPDYYTSYIPAQQSWINTTLSSRPDNTHAFAFTHKNILGGNHKDNMFGGNTGSSDAGDGCNGSVCQADSTVISGTFGLDGVTPLTVGQKRSYMDNFISSLQSNNVKYMISGHDHHHYNSIVKSPLGNSSVHQLICASDSSKWYTPAAPYSNNDTPVEQQLNTTGYYIFTVDGPRVNIDYFADSQVWSNNTPTLNFVKRSTTGYSLNGKEVIVAQAGSYVMNDDTTKAATMEPGFLGTTMNILSGTNASTAKTNGNKATKKAVNTGWAAKGSDTISDVLSLWGMTDLGATSTDKFVLSMSYDPSVVVTVDTINQGKVVALSTKDANGNWVNAVNQNVGGKKKFVLGPWSSAYPLGYYGVDPGTHTAWAVVNTSGSGQFAVVQN